MTPGDDRGVESTFMDSKELRQEAVDRAFVEVDRAVPGLHLGIQPYGPVLVKSVVAAVVEVLADHGFTDAADALRPAPIIADNPAEWLAALAGSFDD